MRATRGAVQECLEKLSTVRQGLVARGAWPLEGFGGRGALGQRRLDAALASVPLSTWMRHFLAAHGALLPPAAAATCQQLQRSWDHVEALMHAASDAVLQQLRERSARLLWPPSLPALPRLRR